MILLSSSLAIFAQDNQENTDKRDKSYRQQNSRTRNANRNEAPSEVQQAWQLDHAYDGNPTWQQNNGQWHAQYKDQGSDKKVDSYYDRSGQQVDTHRQMRSQDMPSAYNQNVNRRYHTVNNYDVIDRTTKSKGSLSIKREK